MIHNESRRKSRCSAAIERRGACMRPGFVRPPCRAASCVMRAGRSCGCRMVLPISFANCVRRRTDERRAHLSLTHLAGRPRLVAAEPLPHGPGGTRKRYRRAATHSHSVESAYQFSPPVRGLGQSPPLRRSFRLASKIRCWIVATSVARYSLAPAYKVGL
jgi:hypothetical protein